jgi:hypothetical protein
MNNTTSSINESELQVIIDRLSVCFTDPNQEHVNASCNVLISDKCGDGIPGIKLTTNARYKIRAMIPVPFMVDSDERHPVCFEAGPFHKGLPSYRLDFNPSKLSGAGIEDLLVFLETVTDATGDEFFALGRVTRADVAVDLPGFTLDDVIVSTKRKQKHGVYSDRYGIPETVYLGTPRSARVVAYTKFDKTSGKTCLRLECRLKPRCLGYEIAQLANPLAKVELLPVHVLKSLPLSFPYRLLADSIRVRGSKRAIDLFDPATRKLINKALVASDTLLPDTTAIWAKWPDALVNVGLGKGLGAIPSTWLEQAA